MQDHLRESITPRISTTIITIEQKPQKIQREIPSQFRVERRIPEQKNAGAYTEPE